MKADGMIQNAIDIFINAVKSKNDGTSMFCLKYNNMNTLNLFSLQNPVTYMFSYDSLNSPITGRVEISVYLSLIHTTNFISIYSLYTYNYTK